MYFQRRSWVAGGGTKAAVGGGAWAGKNGQPVSRPQEEKSSSRGETIQKVDYYSEETLYTSTTTCTCPLVRVSHLAFVTTAEAFSLAGEILRD